MFFQRGQIAAKSTSNSSLINMHMTSHGWHIVRGEIYYEIKTQENPVKFSW